MIVVVKLKVNRCIVTRSCVCWWYSTCYGYVLMISWHLMIVILWFLFLV